MTTETKIQVLTAEMENMKRVIAKYPEPNNPDSRQRLEGLKKQVVYFQLEIEYLKNGQFDHFVGQEFGYLDLFLMDIGYFMSGYKLASGSTNTDRLLYQTKDGKSFVIHLRIGNSLDYHELEVLRVEPCPIQEEIDLLKR